MMDLRAAAAAEGEAVIIDSKIGKGVGVTVDTIVRWGTLRVGDIVVAGSEYGKVKALQTNEAAAAAILNSGGSGGGKGKGKGGGSKGGGDGGGGGEGAGALVDVPAAPPGTPVRVLGLKGVPTAGEYVLVVPDEERAKAVVEGRARRAKAQSLAAVSTADAFKRAVEREEYDSRRKRRAAFQAALDRERKRRNLRKAGAPIPPDLQLQPWEVAILAEGRDGRVVGLDASGRRLRQQGGQQSEVRMDHAAAAALASTVEAGGEGGDAPAVAVAAAAAAAAAAAGGSGSGSTGPKQVAFIIKADSSASLVALQDALSRVPSATREVLPRVVHSSVGELSEQDVQLAADMTAHILCFNAKVAAPVAKSAERRKLTITSGRVIYHLLDAVCDLLADHMAPVEEDTNVATAEVKALFALNSKAATPARVAGCVITEGTFAKSGMSRFLVVRDGATVGEAPALASLMHLKDKVESVKKGSECGIMLEGFADFVVGDKIVAVKHSTRKPKLVVRFD